MPASGNRSEGELDERAGTDNCHTPRLGGWRRRRAAGLRAGPSFGARASLNDRDYHVGRVERSLYWVTDGTYQAAFAPSSPGTRVLAAADVFTASTTFWVMESIRLDLGYGSQVHP
jgi:hypothetical protein